jgi:hypothetical protein
MQLLDDGHSLPERIRHDYTLRGDAPQTFLGWSKDRCRSQCEAGALNNVPNQKLIQAATQFAIRPELRRKVYKCKWLC